MSLLEVSHLKKAYNGHVAVDDLSFHVDAGEIFGLLGPNGAGKSTAMTIVAGLRHADGGTVTIGGETIGKGHQRYKLILGVVPQDLAIYPDLTGRENLDFFGSLYGIEAGVLRKRVDRVLEQIGLTEHAGRYADTYSGGMKRRLNFGAALLHEPRLVILDEPTVGVDPQSRSHLLDCVRQLAANGVGVIYASHYMEEVEAICQRVAIIDHGHLLQQGALDDLLDATRADLYIRVPARAQTLADRLTGLAEISPDGEDHVQLVVRRERKAAPGTTEKRLAKVFDLLAGSGIEVLSTETREHNLERLFLELTGRKLRD